MTSAVPKSTIGANPKNSHSTRVNAPAVIHRDPGVRCGWSHARLCSSSTRRPTSYCGEYQENVDAHVEVAALDEEGRPIGRGVVPHRWHAPEHDELGSVQALGGQHAQGSAEAVARAGRATPGTGHPRGPVPRPPWSRQSPPVQQNLQASAPSERRTDQVQVRAAAHPVEWWSAAA